MDTIIKTIPVLAKEALDQCVTELDQIRTLFLRKPDTDFTRERKITFDGFIRCCIQMEGSTLQNELLKYFNFDPNAPTKSAFIQQRAKVLPEAFEYLFFMFTQKIADIMPLKTLHGYRIVAADGTDINIPYNSLDLESFQKNGDKKGYNQLHLNALQDVLNGFYVDAHLDPDKKTHERSAFIRMVDRNYVRVPTIYLCDRGYEGWNVFAHLIESGQKFVIRLKDDDSNGIISTYKFDYDENHEFDQYIETTLTWRQTNEIKADREHYTYVARENFDFFSESSDRYFIHLRILCIEIAPGKYEYLATNLECSEFSISDFKELYHLRWNEEGSFRDLKYTVGLLSFHCRKADYIRQEIWAGLILMNFCESIARSVVIDQGSKNSRGRKYTYLVNFATAVCICRAFQKSLLPTTNVTRLISRFIIPVRPGRSFERKMKSQSARYFIYRAS